MKGLLLLTVFVVLGSVSGEDPVKPVTPPVTTTTPATPDTTTVSTTTPATSTQPPTTTLAPPTTPAPAPAPPADGRGHWKWEENNKTCIMAQMAVSTKISYPLDNINVTKETEIKVPTNATANGSCAESIQYIKLIWGDHEDSLKLTFGKNDSTELYYISQITLSVYADNQTFPNISAKALNTTMIFESNTIDYKTSLNSSYRCSRVESMPLYQPKSNHSNAVLVLDKVQLQAFHTAEDAGFGSAQDCDVPDIVPIAVGCALAALVFVVLLAYLIGRRRSQARGYLSM